jgi:hypothetical protein
MQGMYSSKTMLIKEILAFKKKNQKWRNEQYRNHKWDESKKAAKRFGCKSAPHDQVELNDKYQVQTRKLNPTVQAKSKPKKAESKGQNSLATAGYIQ